MPFYMEFLFKLLVTSTFISHTISTYVHFYCFHIFVHYTFQFVVFVLMLYLVQCWVCVPYLANKSDTDVGTESQAVGPL